MHKVFYIMYMFNYIHIVDKLFVFCLKFMYEAKRPFQSFPLFVADGQYFPEPPQIWIFVAVLTNILFYLFIICLKYCQLFSDGTSCPA